MRHQNDTTPTERRAAALEALDALGDDRDERALLRVRCGRSHHVAAVFSTSAGVVFESRVGPHAHGDRDFVDAAHHASRHGSRYVDVLDAGRYADDLVPAACECGMHELSRAEMQHEIAVNHHTMQLK